LGLIERGTGIGWTWWARTIAIGVSALYGTLPVNASKATMPSE
jgi:hypothetical protein